jgi:hypothetical protein
MKAPKIQSSEPISGLYLSQFSIFHSFTIHHNFYVIASTQFSFSKRSDLKVFQHMPYNILILLSFSLVWFNHQYPLNGTLTLFEAYFHARWGGMHACMSKLMTYARRSLPAGRATHAGQILSELPGKEGYPWPSRLTVRVWGWQTNIEQGSILVHSLGGHGLKKTVVLQEIKIYQ